MFDVKTITSPIEFDCAATCLQMILAHYGIDVDLDTLTKECNTGIVGASGADIKRAGEKHGLQIHAYKIDADELLDMDRPSIIHWRFNHWCVCCGLNDNGDVVIINPDKGRYPLKRNTFKTLFSGTALFNGEPQRMERKIEPKVVNISREEFNLLDATNANTIYYVAELDGTVTMIKGDNK